MANDSAAFVGSIPENYDRYLGPVLFEPYAEDLAARLNLPANSSLLELACGTGIVTRRLRDGLDATTRITATDLNPAMMSFAAQKFQPADAIEWKQVDAIELPFPDQSFDAVVCQFGLMFFSDKPKVASEVHRVLKPGGLFAFNVWDAIEHNDLPEIAHSIIVKFFEDNPPDFYGIPFSFHEPEKIQALLDGAGFREIELSVVPRLATSPSAAELKKGLVHGNPVITAIRERDESSVPAIEDAIEAAVVERCGDKPVRARMQAVVCTTRK